MSTVKSKTDFNRFRNADYGQAEILKKLLPREKDLETYLGPWWKISHENNGVYPSQGLLSTPFDYLESGQAQMLPQELVIQTLRLRLYLLELFNHPYRIASLQEVTKRKFEPPAKIDCPALESSFTNGLALSIGDVGARVEGAERKRISRTERYGSGPFVKLGRQGRSFFVGSASPDVWNSSIAISTMAASLCLAGIPRNGVVSSIKRQADLARESFAMLDDLADLVLAKRTDKLAILKLWRQNIMGVVESSPEAALARAESLYKAGVRCFRIYSPEPGVGPVDTVVALRKHFGKEIEIFSGQVVSVGQAQKIQEVGADGIFVGIGGGGRCITGVRSGSVIDWPELVWRLRGKLTIPVIVEGGASDHVATTLLLGGSGISVSRVVSGGTIESPGGLLYYSDSHGHLYKPYGGEASARTKYLDGKMLPFDIPAFVEGETTKAELSFVKHALPTLTYNLHLLTEDAILALVFRGVENIEQLQALNPSPLRQTTSSGVFQMNTH